MQNLKNLCLAIVCLIGLFYILPAGAVTKTGVDANEATLSQQVPFELARFAAEHYAKQFYGKMTFYDNTTYYDVNGLPSVYCIILVDPNIMNPDPNEIREQVRNQSIRIKEIKEIIKAVGKEDISGKKKAEKIAELNEQIRESRKKMAGVDHFATFYCGATEDHVPVIRSHRGLPDHMTTLPDVEQNISSKPDMSGMKLGKVLYLGVFDMAYELVPESENGKNAQSTGTLSPQGGFTDKTRFILVRSGKTFTQDELKEDIEKRLVEIESDTEDARALKAKQEERKKVVEEKWQRIKYMYGRSK